MKWKWPHTFETTNEAETDQHSWLMALRCMTVTELWCHQHVKPRHSQSRSATAATLASAAVCCCHGCSAYELRVNEVVRDAG